MAPRSPPSFFKILLDPSAPHLPLPSAFVSKHLENKIPEKPILRSSNGGFSWQLRIKQIDGDYCFVDGWLNVVKDIQLVYGDFLVFRLVDPSTFNVSIFSPNGCEKDLYSKVKVEHDKDAVVHEEDVDNDVEEEEDIDDVVHENDVNNNDEDEDDEEEEEANDEDDDEEEEEDDDDGCEEDDDEDDEEAEDDDGDGDIDGHDGDPFFMIVISKTHQLLMRLPPEFMRLAGIEGERRITVKNPDDKEWQMMLRSEKGQCSRYYLTSGWRDFHRSNELSEGDKCLFKFIKKEDKLCLAKVTRKKARTAAGDSPTDATKRKRKRGGQAAGVEGERKMTRGRLSRQKSRVVYF